MLARLKLTFQIQKQQTAMIPLVQMIMAITGLSGVNLLCGGVEWQEGGKTNGWSEFGQENNGVQLQVLAT